MITVKEYTDKIVQNTSQVIVGKDEAIKQIVICFLAGGHVLLEDLPGTGKQYFTPVWLFQSQQCASVSPSGHGP